MDDEQLRPDRDHTGPSCRHIPHFVIRRALRLSVESRQSSGTEFSNVLRGGTGPCERIYQINPLLSQWQQRAPTPAHAALRRISRYFLGVIFSTVLSTLATAPYTLYHFHRLPLYGLLANLIAVPITVLWVMPGLIMALS